MRKFNLIFLFFLAVFFSSIYASNSYANDTIIFHPKINGFKGEVFTLELDSINIQGVFWGNRKKARPLLVFIQGSQPIPLFASRYDSIFYPLIPYQLINGNENYNYILLSKNSIPAIAPLKDLNEDHFYLNEKTGLISEEYIKTHNLPFYVNAYTELINNIEPDVYYSELIVMGHSQGSRIAAELASNKKIDKVVYMSADPLGRIATMYDQEYAKFKERNDEKLEFYQSLFNEKFSDSLFYGDLYSSWESFSKPSLISLTRSEKPILIVFGDMDRSCPNCYVFNFLPEYFKNIDVFKYENYDHNYFDMKGNNNWDKVVKDIFIWLKGH